MSKVPNCSVPCCRYFCTFCTFFLPMLLSFFQSFSRTKDLNAKAGDKINKGLNKLKHGVLGKSMEGIIDAPTDPAFDMAEICKNEEDEEDPEDLEDQELEDGCNR